jgi:hypothetical protein
MTKSVRLLLMGAALTGFVAGQNAFAQDTTKTDDAAKADSGKKAKKAKVEKHACKMIARARAAAPLTAARCRKRRNSFSPLA